VKNLGLWLLLLSILYPASLFGQAAPDAAKQRAQMHSKQVHGAVEPGQIPYLLAHTSGDVHLASRGIVDGIMPPDAASILENMTCDRASDVIVLGKLANGVSSPTVDQGYIYTDWDVAVERVFKDSSQSPVQPGQTIVVTRPGGELTINGRHVDAIEDDFPRFHSGEKIVLYLQSLPLGTYALSSPRGFFLSGSKVIPIDKLFAPKFANMGGNTFLQLVQSAATTSCPAPFSPGGEQ